MPGPEVVPTATARTSPPHSDMPLFFECLFSFRAAGWILRGQGKLFSGAPWPPTMHEKASTLEAPTYNANFHSPSELLFNRRK